MPAGNDDKAAAAAQQTCLRAGLVLQRRSQMDFVSGKSGVFAPLRSRYRVGVIVSKSSRLGRA